MMTAIQYLHDAKTYFIRRDFIALRRQVANAVQASLDFNDLNIIYTFMTAAFSETDLKNGLIFLREHVDRVIRSASKENKHEFLLISARINLALGELKSYTEDAHNYISFGGDPETRRILSAVSSAIALSQRERKEQSKVFCIGLSRTGTKSLSQSLSMLGFHAAHFFNPITKLYLRAPDWDLFDAFSDVPVCADFERLFYHYPNSKFILVRRDVRSWTHSMKNHMSSVRGSTNISDLRQCLNPFSASYRPQLGRFDYDLYFRHDSYESAAKNYYERVSSFFSKNKSDRYLELDFDREDPWRDLCKFIEALPPEIPFPWENKGTRSKSVASW